MYNSIMDNVQNVSYWPQEELCLMELVGWLVSALVRLPMLDRLSEQHICYFNQVMIVSFQIVFNS